MDPSKEDDVNVATVTSSLVPLALLACPVGMGVMMWRMNRAGKKQERQQNEARPASVEVLHEEQRRVFEQIDRLEPGATDGDRVGRQP